MTATPLRDAAISARALADLADLAGQTGGEMLEVVELLDEEVVLLDGPGADHVAPLPWFEDLRQDQHDTVLAVAARSLAVRGLARPSAIDAGSGDLAVALPQAVYGVLAARRAASAVVMAQRRTSSSSTFQALYRQRDGLMVVEEVSPGGLHSFRAGPLEAALSSLAAFSSPGQVTPTEKASRVIQLTDVAQGRGFEELNTALWVTVVSAVLSSGEGPDDVLERHLSVYTGPDYRRVARPSGANDLDISDVDHETLTSVLTTLMDVGSAS